MKIKIAVGATALLLATFAPAANAANLVTNGDFSGTTFTQNNQFGTGYGGQGVTGWQGNGGYNLYFFAGTATTTSANSQYGGTAERLWAVTASPTGGNFVALDGDQGGPGQANVQGAISQTIGGLTIGSKYLLTFSWGAGQLQSRNGATTEQLQVTFGTNPSDVKLTGVLSDPNHGFNGWVNEAFTFTANAASETLTFLSIGTPSGLPPIATLDGVSLTLVPEPAALGLLGVGLVGLMAARRRA